VDVSVVMPWTVTGITVTVNTVIVSSDLAEPILERLRGIDGFEVATLAEEPRPITGGFWATLLLVRLHDAPVTEVVVRLMPDSTLAAKEITFQREAGRQGLPVPPVLLAGDGEAGLGADFMVMGHAPGAPPLAGLDGPAALRRLPSIARELPVLLGSVMAEVHRLDPRPIAASLQGRGLCPDTAELLEHWTAWAGALGRTDLSLAAERLADRRPSPDAPVVCHGDLHPLNLLVQDGRWTVLDWTAAIIAEPAYDLAFTSLLLRHPPLPAPLPLRPAIAITGRYVARRFEAGYAASGRPLPNQERLEWHTALHSLRVLLESETWRQEGTVEQHTGHPWLSIAPFATRALVGATGVTVG
jgi:aminoglycoside phosphotransferase (APT) family kinase protein